MNLSTEYIRAQSYSTQLIDNINANFNYTDNVIVERWRPSTVYFNDGSLLVRPASFSNSNELLVTLLDTNGAIVLDKRYSLSGKNLVPKAIAYNPATYHYIIVGNEQNILGNNRYDAWYLLLDYNLNFVNFGGIQLQSNSVIGANTNSTIIMDVCAVTNTQATDADFAFVGTILENGNDPTPKVNGITQPTDRRMYIATLDVSTFNINAMEYDMSIQGNAIDPYCLPAAIIEIPGNNGGYFVTGTGVINEFVNFLYNDAKGIFYFRADYSMNTLQCISLDNQNPNDFFTMSKLRYDNDAGIGHQDGVILVAGTMLSSNYNAFIFDKILDVNTTTTINPFSMDNIIGWGGISIGAKKILNSNPLYGIPKVGYLGSNYSNGNKILGRIYHNNIEETLPIMLDCLYFDADLSSFTSNQYTDIYYYPRIQDNITPLQFYTGHNYDEIWYPNHACTELVYNYQYADAYGLAGLCNTNTPTKRIAYNVTNNYFDNNCNYDKVTLAADMIDFEFVAQVDAPGQQPNINTNTPTISQPTNGTTVEDCSQTFFRQQPTINSANYIFTETNNHCTIQCSEQALGFSIYNAMGALIYKTTEVSNLYSFNIETDSEGMYIIKIQSTSGNHIIKFIKK